MFDASILLSITVFCIGSLVLNSLLGLGEVMIREGQVERGVTILFFVAASPTTPSLYREMAEQSLDKLQNELSQERIKTAFSDGQAAELEDIVRFLPDSLS